MYNHNRIQHTVSWDVNSWLDIGLVLKRRKCCILCEPLWKTLIHHVDQVKSSHLHKVICKNLCYIALFMFQLWIYANNVSLKVHLSSLCWQFRSEPPEMCSSGEISYSSIKMKKGDISRNKFKMFPRTSCHLLHSIFLFVIGVLGFAMYWNERFHFFS